MQLKGFIRLSGDFFVLIVASWVRQQTFGIRTTINKVDSVSHGKIVSFPISERTGIAHLKRNMKKCLHGKGVVRVYGREDVKHNIKKNQEDFI